MPFPAGECGPDECWQRLFQGGKQGAGGAEEPAPVRQPAHLAARQHWGPQRSQDLLRFGHHLGRGVRLRAGPGHTLLPGTGTRTRVMLRISVIFAGYFELLVGLILYF